MAFTYGLSVPAPLAFFSGTPGAGEFLVLFLVILVLFGPKRLPGIARAIGSVMSQLRRASREFSDQIMQMDRSSIHDIAPDPEEEPSRDVPDSGRAERGDDDSGDTRA